MTGADRYWDGTIAKLLGVDRDVWNFRVEQPNATKLIAKILKKAERNFKKIK
jgi:RNase adaptor protein for sRNA GlmZ degradation